LLFRGFTHDKPLQYLSEEWFREQPARGGEAEAVTMQLNRSKQSCSLGL